MSDYSAILDELEANFPALSACRGQIAAACDVIAKCYDQHGTLFVCGNGGSCADADHITGELLKGFCRRRPMTSQEKQRLGEVTDEETASLLTAKLQRGLSAVSLMNFPAASSAVANDLGPDLAQAQLLYAMGRPGDVLLGISTSGNAANVANAVAVARLKGISVIGMTNEIGGRLAKSADVAIKVPVKETFRTQEYHLPVYHAICRIIEARYFEE